MSGVTPIVCRDYNQEDCKTKNANCIWAGGKGCIKRNGVNSGARFKYNSRGEVVDINEPAEDEFVYSPDDPQFEERMVPPLTRTTLESGTYGITFVPAFPCVNGQQ
jgi:hypothetical protein